MSSSRYPTRQEIIDAMPELEITQSMAALTLWKEDNYTQKWRAKSTEEKIQALEKLAYEIYYSIAPGEPSVLYVLVKDRYAFHPQRNAILLDKRRASILSTLHEIGHAIYGPSELMACAYSIKLFAKVFPNEYQKLRWHGHMLRKPSN